MQTRRFNWLVIASVLFGVFGLTMGVQARPTTTLAAGYRIDNPPPAGVTPEAGAAVLVPADAQSPTAPNANINVFNYQGVLRKPDGTLASGTYSMTFGLYSQPAGNNNLGYSELIANVVVRDGIFNVLLGDRVGIADGIVAQSPIYLGIKVDNDVEMAPRQRIHAVPIALGLKPNPTINGGLNVNNGALNLNNAGINLTGRRMIISNPDWTGYEVANTPWDGFHVNGASASGLASLNANYGVYTYASRDSGVVVDGAANHGVSVSGVGETGLIVWNSRVDGVWVQGVPGWSGWFGGKVLINGICQGCTAAIYGQNSGVQDLQPGDVVTFRGNTTSLGFQDQPALGVDQAGAQDSVIGVVYGKAELKEVKRGDKTLTILVPVEDAAKPGDYVSIVTHGIARVRVSSDSNNVQSGNLLTISPTAGRAERLQTNGTTPVASYVSVIGTALETPQAGNDRIWVLVNPR